MCRKIPFIRSSVYQVPQRSNYTPSRKTWTPVLSDGDRERALIALKSIVGALNTVETDDPSLANGVGGVALALAYLSSLEEIPDWQQRVSMMLSRALDRTLSSENPRSFMTGATGIAWALEHLERRFGLPVDVEHYTRVDVLLSEHLSKRPWQGVYELSHGLVGYGVYAVDGVSSARRRELLEQVITCLEATALPVPGGLAWWTAPQNITAAERAVYPNGYVNLGVAHGIPSVIAILAEACRLHVAEEKAERLLHRSVQWLLARKQPKVVGSHFPSILALGVSNTLRRSRVAWCYGDLGLSAALYSAARNINDTTLANEATDIAISVASRDPNTSGVSDAGICHGAAGNGHIFNRLFQDTHEQAFLDAAQYWLRRTLAYYDEARSDIMCAWRSESQPPASCSWSNNPGFFGGIAGVGLALQAAIATTEPEWDRILLI